MKWNHEKDLEDFVEDVCRSVENELPPDGEKGWMMSATHYVDECVVRAFDTARKLLNDETFVYSPDDIAEDELKDQFEQQCRERFADTHLIYMGEEDKVKDACLGLITWTIRNEENLSPNQKVEKIDGLIREMEAEMVWASSTIGAVLTGDSKEKKKKKDKGHSL